MCCRIYCNHFNGFNYIHTQFRCFFNRFIQMPINQVIRMLIITYYKIKYRRMNSSFQNFSWDYTKTILIFQILNTFRKIKKSFHIFSRRSITYHDSHTFLLFLNSFSEITTFMVSNDILLNVFIQFFTRKQWSVTINWFFILSG